MRSSSLLIVGAVAGLAMSTAAKATLIASDSFTGTTPFDAASGTGWSTGWSFNANASLTGASLINPAVTSSGAAIQSADSSVFRSLSTGFTGSFYSSFLVNTGGSNFANVTFYGSDRDTEEVFGVGASWDGGGLNPNFGSWVQWNQNHAWTGFPAVVSSTTPIDAATHLVIVEVQWSTTGNSHVNMYVDPSIVGGILPATPSYSFDLNQGDGTIPLPAIAQIRLEQSGGSQIDEIRIGTELSDVVAVPEPTALALIGLSASLGLRRRRA